MHGKGEKKNPLTYNKLSKGLINVSNTILKKKKILVSNYLTLCYAEKLKLF